MEARALQRLGKGGGKGSSGNRADGRAYRDVAGAGGKGGGPSGGGKGGKGGAGRKAGSCNDEWAAADATTDVADLLHTAEDKVSGLEHAAKAAAQAFKERSTPLLARRKEEAKAELGEAKAELARRREASRVPEDRQVFIHSKIDKLLAEKNKSFERARLAYNPVHVAEEALETARADHKRAEAKIAELQRESDAIRMAQRAAEEANPTPAGTKARAQEASEQWEQMAESCARIRDDPNLDGAIRAAAIAELPDMEQLQASLKGIL